MVHRIAQLRRAAAEVAGFPVAYGIAILAFAAAFGLRYALSMVLGYGVHDWLLPAPFLTFYPTIIVITFFLGLGPGVLVAALGGMSAWYFFLDPVHSLAVHSNRLITLSLYLCAAAINIALVRLLTLSLERLESEKSKSDAHAQEREILFQELQHRTSNHLQLLASLLETQRRRVHDESARQAMKDASLRLAIIGKLHRKLYDPTRGRIDADALVRELSGDILTTWGRQNISCNVNCASLRLPPERSTAVALIVTELISNAIEHGLTGRCEGTITVDLKLDDGGHARLIIADDGTGLPPGFNPATTPSLGLRIVRTLARQLGGTFEMEGGGGTTCRVTFPIDAAGDASGNPAGRRLSAA